jgi:hypothetical protein
MKHVLFHKNKGKDLARDFFFHSSTALVGLDLLTDEVSRSYSDTPHLVGLLWPGHRPIAEKSTCQHTPLTKKHTSGLPVGFEPTVSKNKRPQSHALYQVAIGIVFHL